ncbi:MAG: hypothetical protein AABZ14_02575, partial [Candidatus Margulisiibacteriota bacterium]
MKIDLERMQLTNYSYSTENRTTDIIDSYQTYPRELQKYGAQFTLMDLLQSQYASNVDLQENYKITTSRATSDLSVIKSISVFNNATHLSTKLLNNTLLPSQLPIHLNLGQSYDDYIDTTRGLKYRQSEQLNVDTGLSILSVGLTPRFSKTDLVQYLRSSADISLDEIASNYSTYLSNHTYDFALDGTQRLSATYSLLFGYGYRKIVEDSASATSSPNSSAFSSHSLGAGLKATPLPDLTLSYTYTYKMNSNDLAFASFQNYADSFQAQYTPITLQTPKMKTSVNMTFRRDHSWGVGLNDFAQLQNNQVNSTTLATKIQQIDNISSTGVVAANIEIPMSERSNGNIEKFIFSAEGN